MKQLKLIAISILCILATSCSKKNDAVAPALHTIKITINGSADFNLTVITSVKSGATEKLVANSVVVAKGTTYTYSEQLQSTGFLSFSLLSVYRIPSPILFTMMIKWRCRKQTDRCIPTRYLAWAISCHSIKPGHF